MTFFENMTVFEKITFLMFILMSIICIAQVVEIICWHKKIKKIDNKIKIRHSKFGSYIWVLVAVLNITVESYMMIDSIPTYNYNPRTNGYLYIILMWLAFLIYTFLPIAFVRYHYITPDGLIAPDAKDDMYSKENVKYRINGDKLELYYKKLSSAIEYKIVDKKDELTEMLSANYKLYEKSNKKEKKS